jgi:hypothetical protein
MRFTDYFESVVRLKRPDIQLSWIERVLDAPLKTAVQANGRLSLWWGLVPDAGNRVLRVIILEDGGRFTTHILIAVGYVGRNPE